MIGLTLLWWMGLDGIRPGTSVEGQLYLLGGVSALTHDHLDMSPDGGMLCRQIGQRDPLPLPGRPQGWPRRVCPRGRARGRTAAAPPRAAAYRDCRGRTA